MGRFNWSYADKYIVYCQYAYRMVVFPNWELTTNGASSLLHHSAWVLKEESWLKNVEFLKQLEITYGIWFLLVNQDAIAAYNSLKLYESGLEETTIDGKPVATWMASTATTTPDLKWESETHVRRRCGLGILR